jgi:adenosylcobinamide-GDP ribazoletransferase
LQKPACAIGIEQTLLSDLLMAFTLLTRLPVGLALRGGWDGDLGRSVWAYPLVGAVIGAIGAAVYLTCHHIGLPIPLGAVCALAAEIVVTGALHEDGLADTADGFGGGSAPGRKLEIMRDSRIGTYGAVALMLSLAVRGTAIAGIARIGSVAGALVAAGVLGRCGLIIVTLVTRPARADGLSASLRTPHPLRAVLGLGLGMALACSLLPFPYACGAALATTGTALGSAWLAARQIGGYTGDVLGATEVAVECVVLGMLSANAGPG